jgi:hypothetical protein
MIIHNFLFSLVRYFLFGNVTVAKPRSKQLATVLEGVIRTVLPVRGPRLPGFVVRRLKNGLLD